MAEPEPRPDPDADLVARAKSGDRAAFGELLRLHQGAIHRLAIRMLGSRAEADDATQEALLRIWRSLRTFDGRARFSTWVYRITLNVCLNAIRRRPRTRAEQPADDARLVDPGASPAQEAEGRRLRAHMAAAFDALSPSLKVTAALVLFEGKSLAEAADILGCAEGTVAWRVHEARRKLRDALVQHEGKGGAR